MNSTVSVCRRADYIKGPRRHGGNVTPGPLNPIRPGAVGQIGGSAAGLIETGLTDRGRRYRDPPPGREVSLVTWRAAEQPPAACR